jgi:hypothetical protein
LDEFRPVGQSHQEATARRCVKTDQRAGDPTLEALEPFIGEWNLEPQFTFPVPEDVTGRVVFQWMSNAPCRAHDRSIYAHGLLSAFEKVTDLRA